MLMVVKKNLILLYAYFRLNLSAVMEYRTSFLLQTFGMILNNASFAFFWWVLFDQVGSIAGYGFFDIMTLWAISSSAFGIAFILFGNLKNLTEIIVKGELDIYLLQPKDVVLNVLASKTVVAAWGDLIYGITLYIIICITRGSFASIGLYFIFCITGAAIFTGTLLTVNTLSFYFGNASGVRGLVFEFLITFTLYPMGIYKGFVRLIIFTLIPAGFISVLPMEILVSFNLWQMIAVIGAAILWIIISISFFNRGLKRYESGNLIISRM